MPLSEPTTDDSEWGAEQLALSPSDLSPGETDQWLQIIPPTPRSHTLPINSHRQVPILSQPTPPERPPIHHAHTWSFGQPPHSHPFFHTLVPNSNSNSSTSPHPPSLPPNTGFQGQNYVQTSLGFSPSVLHPSIKTHRSISSVASIESFQSGLSGNTRWSTVTGSDCASEGPDLSCGSQSHGTDELTGLGTSSELAPPQLTTLSIDPSLFKPKANSKSKVKSKSKKAKGKGEDEGEEENENDNNNNTANDNQDDDENDDEDDDVEEDDNLTTARPRFINPDLPDPEKFRKEARDDVPKKKNSHARKQTADHIPRPRNAFILFRKHVVDAKLIPASVEMRHQNVSIITAKMWSEAPMEQKAHFNELARIEKEEHMKKYPGYRYQPVYRRTNVIRRRVRKDEAEEEKCKSVAELLLKGKTGSDLETEIKERILTDELPVAIPKPKVNSRRGSAVELSKGALRALRAQARAQHTRSQSADWSDTSRTTSVDPEPIPPHSLNSRTSRVPAHVRKQTALSMTGTPETIPSVELGEDLGEGCRDDVDNFSFSLGREPPHMQYFYPQPPVSEPASFDPRVSLLNDPVGVDPDSFNHNTLSLRYNIPSDVLFGAWDDGPSPRSGTYPGRLSERWDNNIFNQNMLGIDMGLTAESFASNGGSLSGSGGGVQHNQHGQQHQHPFLSSSGTYGDSSQISYHEGGVGAAGPPGSEMIPLDGWPFDENGLIDFEAALAQAEEVSSW